MVNWYLLRDPERKQSTIGQVMKIEGGMKIKGGGLPGTLTTNEMGLAM